VDWGWRWKGITKTSQTEVKITPEVEVTSEGKITATQVKITRKEEVLAEG